MKLNRKLGKSFWVSVMADLEKYRDMIEEVNSTHFFASKPILLAMLAMLDIIETAPKGCCCGADFRQSRGEQCDHTEKCKKRLAAWERLEKL